MIATEPRTPTLEFTVDDVAALSHVAVPTLGFRVRIASGGTEVRSLALNVQLRIDATRRGYSDDEKPRLLELFGPPERFRDTVRSLLWAQTSLVVPAFSNETVAELPVPCSYDFDIAAAKYLDALGGSTVPIELLFSGTVFYTDTDGRLQAAPVPWDREVSSELPVQVWKDALEHAFPGTTWIRLRRDSFDRLYAYKAQQTLPSWEATIDQLLDADE